MNKRQFWTAATAAAALLLGTTACQPAPETTAVDPNLPGGGTPVTATYSALEERFQTEIVLIGLEQLGYKIEKPEEIEYGTMHVAVANGDTDFTATHWERLHQTFYDRVGGEATVERVGILVDNVRQGYLIDKASIEKYGIETLTDLKDGTIARAFDTNGDGKANLTGCNTGWGCELVIEHHLDAYDLRGTVQHDQGKYFALMADTITRYKRGEPILYFSWTPLWVHGVLEPGTDVEWVAVPFTDLPEEQGEVSAEQTTIDGKNLGFAVDRQRILANKAFLAENPAAAAFFELVSIPIDDISAQNQLIKNAGENTPADIRRHAETWVEQHQSDFDSWVEQAQQVNSPSQ